MNTIHDPWWLILTLVVVDAIIIGILLWLAPKFDKWLDNIK